MGERRGTKALELWCKRVTQGYDGVSIENMSTSWKDGLAFCALIHHFRPELIDYENLDKNDVYGNNELAFRVAENHLGIPALLDPEDMVCVEIPDRLSILTYLSQFYQTFSSQATTPVKTSPESPTAVERPRTNTGSGQNPPTKLGAGVGGCRVCNQSVFLAQRLLISGHLFHRTCFKCARCGALLSVANYYETQDSKYCCETCPDEERMVVQQSSQSVDDDDDEDDGGGATVTKRLHRRGSSSLVGDRRALFETLAAADCTDDVKASKKAQRPVTLKMADPPIVEEKTAVISDDNDSGVIVVSDKKESSGGDTKTSSVSVSCSRETLSDVLVADEPCKEGDTALAASEDKTIVVPSTGAVESLVTATDELSLPSPPPPPPPPPLLPSFPHGVLPVANGLPESQTSFSHVMLFPDDLKPPTPDKELDVHVVKPPLKDVPILSSSLSDDLKQVLESPPSFATMADNGVEEQVLAESPEDLEIKTLANKLLKMDYYESNNKDVPVPSPRKKIKSPIKIINYPENLNPFDDVEENDNENKINSTNPFGSDSEDEDREHDVIEIKTNVSLNPFSSDEDENEIRCQPPPPLPKPRMILSPVLKLRYQTHRKQSSTSSISSYATTPRKKKPAPPPPLPKSRLSIESTEYLNGAQTSSPNSLEDSSCSGSERSSNNQEHYRLHKSTHGKWKRKKGPAPQCPIPQRRRIKPMPMKDIKQELLDIEIKQQELERQGVKLEKDIRLKCNEDLNNVDVEEMVLQLFELVNEKNELFRKHAELMYLRRQHNLEEEHAELEYQIRVLMSQPDTTKTDTEKEREEELIQRLVEVVGRRNEIVENLEKDRLREVEEDRSVFNQIGTFAQDEMLPCVKPVEVTVVEGKKNFSKRLLKNIKKVKSKKEKPDESSPSRSLSNSSHNKGTLKKFMTLGHSSKKFLRPKSS